MTASRIAVPQIMMATDVRTAVVERLDTGPTILNVSRSEIKATTPSAPRWSALDRVRADFRQLGGQAAL
jgi:hypothetical protein